jgi:AraC-like DNA-binding protein
LNAVFATFTSKFALANFSKLMRFLAHRPAMPLAEFVDFFWFYDGLTPAHRLERVLPEGSFELLINLREEPRHIFNLEELKALTSFRGAWLAGMHSQSVVIDTAPDSSMMGVHFRPGGAAGVLGIPAGELCDRVIELEGIWGSDAARLRSQLLEAPTPRAKFRCLEHFLIRKAGGRARPLVMHAIRVLQSAPESTTMKKIAAEIGWSHKHLIEQFHVVVGMSPKRFTCVQRFQRAVRMLQRTRPKSLTEVALECGYYDQSHFNAEFRSFSGLTPTEFLRDAQGRENFIPIVGG